MSERISALDSCCHSVTFLAKTECSTSLIFLLSCVFPVINIITHSVTCISFSACQACALSSHRFSHVIYVRARSLRICHLVGALDRWCQEFSMLLWCDMPQWFELNRLSWDTNFVHLCARCAILPENNLWRCVIWELRRLDSRHCVQTNMFCHFRLKKEVTNIITCSVYWMRTCVGTYSMLLCSIR